MKYLALILTIASASGLAETPDPAGYNPFGRHGQFNAVQGNAAANIGPDTNQNGVDKAVNPSTGDIKDFEFQMGGQIDDAVTNTRFCDSSVTTGPMQAACLLIAARPTDPKAWADRVGLRQETTVHTDATGKVYVAGKADLGQKLGEATRVSRWGNLMLLHQRELIGAAALRILPAPARFACTGGDPTANPFNPTVRDCIDHHTASSARVVAARLLLEEGDAALRSANVFSASAEMNQKGTRQLADDEDVTDPMSVARVGATSIAVAMGNGREAPITSNAPTDGTPPPLKFASRLGPEGAGFSDSPTPAVAVAPVGAPGTISAADSLTPGQLNEARQMAYDALREGGGVTPEQLTSGGPLTVGVVEGAGTLAPSQELWAGTLQQPKLAPFDRTQAEAAADRYVAIQAGKITAPKALIDQELTAPARLPNIRAEAAPPVFETASDYYRQFAPRR